MIDTVLPGTPARKAGITSGDTVVAVNGQPIAQWYDLVSVIESNAGKPLALELGPRLAGAQWT